MYLVESVDVLMCCRKRRPHKVTWTVGPFNSSPGEAKSTAESRSFQDGLVDGLCMLDMKNGTEGIAPLVILLELADVDWGGTDRSSRVLADLL